MSANPEEQVETPTVTADENPQPPSETAPSHPPTSESELAAQPVAETPESEEPAAETPESEEPAAETPESQPADDVPGEMVADETPVAEPTPGEMVADETPVAEPAPEGETQPAKLAGLEPGMTVTGTVRSVQSYGAFVDIGVERDGLVHISELKDGFVEKVEDVVKPGDVVTVRVKDVDHERGRISLTMRAEKPAKKKEPKARRLRLKDLTEGQEMTGKVTSIVDFGAFVDIGATTDGLVHISELSDERVNKVTDVLEEGQEVKVRVLQVDRKRNRISLTMREQVAPEVIEEDEGREEPLPTMIELAFARAAERQQQKEKSRRRRGKSGQSELDEIIRRTLDEHRG